MIEQKSLSVGGTDTICTFETESGEFEIPRSELENILCEDRVPALIFRFQDGETLTLKPVSKFCRNIGPCNDGMIPFEKNGKWGYLNAEDGSVQIPPKFEVCQPFSEGLAACALGEPDYPRKARRYGYFDAISTISAAKEEIENSATDCPTFDTTSDSKLKWGYIDHDGNWVIPPQFDAAGTFYRGYAPVLQNNACMIIDRTGENCNGEIYQQIKTKGAYAGAFYVQNAEQRDTLLLGLGAVKEENSADFQSERELRYAQVVEALAAKGGELGESKSLLEPYWDFDWLWSALADDPTSMEIELFRFPPTDEKVAFRLIWEGKKIGGESRETSQTKDGNFVGLFFFIGGKFLLHFCRLEQAERYGDFLVYPHSHDEIWQRDYRKVHLVDFDFFPRGRIVYHIPDQTYWIYHDRCIPTKASAELKQRLGKVKLKHDEHYVCCECCEEYTT